MAMGGLVKMKAGSGAWTDRREYPLVLSDEETFSPKCVHRGQRELSTISNGSTTRIGGFERRALATTKRLVNERSAPASEGELLQSFKSILEAITWPEAHPRMAAMEAKGWGKKTEAELNHPYHLGLLAKELAGSDRGPQR